MNGGESDVAQTRTVSLFLEEVEIKVLVDKTPYAVCMVPKGTRAFDRQIICFEKMKRDQF